MTRLWLPTDMAVSVSEIVGLGESSKFLCLRSLNRRVNPPNTSLVPIRFTTTTTRWSSVVPRALDPKTENQNSIPSMSQKEDLVYVAKLAASSFAGAGAIKYGSALFPEITTPNLVLALAIIFTPALVAVFLLIRESRISEQ